VGDAGVGVLVNFLLFFITRTHMRGHTDTNTGMDSVFLYSPAGVVGVVIIDFASIVII